MNEKIKDSGDDVIELSLVFSLIRKYIVFLIIASIIGGVSAYFYTKYMIPERYQATATVIINNRATDTQFIYPSEISSSQQLAELYSLIVKSDTVMQQVIDELDLNVTYEQLRNSISVQTLSSSQVVEISLISTDPEYAKKVVSTFVKYSKQFMADKVDAGKVDDLNLAAVSNNGYPISPNRKKNTMFGAMVGLAVAVAIVVLKQLLNTKLKSESDIVSTLNVPLLGVIPAVDRKEFLK